RILAGMDLDTAKQSQRLFERQGLKFNLATKVTGVSKGANGLTLTLEPAAGGASTTLEADIVLVATGRVPYTNGLGLEEAGVVRDP
ncbi:FAD-dependent oxidoreductase, partial [Acinetobacter baumannii]